MKKRTKRQLPSWMKMKMPSGYNYSRVRNLVDHHGLHTICTSGKCPNMGECWGNGTATFMILGNICTRDCKFCGVETGKPLAPDPGEPSRIARSVQTLELKHCVITSVDRDDLKDGGAYIWAETVSAVKQLNPDTTVEVLIPDFNGKESLVKMVIDAQPEVISHNLETVRRLTPRIRSRADYQTSLKVIRLISQAEAVSKSGIMLGMGEEEEEVLETMDDLIAAGCKVLTIGQYLAPTKNHIPVKHFVKPETFELYRKRGLEKGFRFVESSPLVRSSYRAEKHAELAKEKNNTKYNEKSNFSGSKIN